MLTSFTVNLLKRVQTGIKILNKNEDKNEDGEEITAKKCVVVEIKI